MPNKLKLIIKIISVFICLKVIFLSVEASWNNSQGYYIPPSLSKIFKDSKKTIAEPPQPQNKIKICLFSQPSVESIKLSVVGPYKRMVVCENHTQIEQEKYIYLERPTTGIYTIYLMAKEDGGYGMNIWAVGNKWRDQIEIAVPCGDLLIPIKEKQMHRYYFYYSQKNTKRKFKIIGPIYQAWIWESPVEEFPTSFEINKAPKDVNLTTKRWDVYEIPGALFPLKGPTVTCSIEYCFDIARGNYIEIRGRKLLPLPRGIEIHKYLPNGLELVKAYPNYTEKKQNCYIWRIKNPKEYTKGEIYLTLRVKEKSQGKGVDTPYETILRLYAVLGKEKALLQEKYSLF